MKTSSRSELEEIRTSGTLPNCLVSSFVRSGALANAPEPKFLFPLDRRGRLSRNIVDHAGNSLHLVDDSMRDAIEKIIRQARPARGHEIHWFHRAQGTYVVVA